MHCLEPFLFLTTTPIFFTMINFNTNANSTQKTWSHHSLQQPKSRPVTIYIPDVIPKSLQLDDSEILNHLKI